MPRPGIEGLVIGGSDSRGCQPLRVTAAPEHRFDEMRDAEAVMQPTLLIAIGGNALLKAGERATVAAMRTHVKETGYAVARVVA